MSDPLAEAVREGALAAIRKRIVTLGQRVARGHLTEEKDGVVTEYLTSEAAHAAVVRAEIEAIIRDIETMELPES